MSVALVCVHFRWLIVPFLIFACVGIGYGASALKFAGDYRVFFGPNNPDFVASENAQATFGKPDNIAFVIIPKEGTIYTEHTLRAVHELTAKSWTLPYVSRVDSLTNFQNTVGEGDDLIVEDLVLDPASLTPARLKEIERIAKAEPLVHGFVASRDSAATIVSATVQLPGDVAQVASVASDKARALRDNLIAKYPNLDVHITGVATLSAAFEEAGQQDAQTLIPAVYVFILVVILVALRSFAAMLGGLLVIALATLVGMGIGGFTGVEITPISLAAPTIILTVAVADAIHVIAGIRTKMRSGMAKNEAIISATALNFAPIGITSLTTVIGFLTLNFSDSPPFHHLGNMSAAGIAAAWLLSITFLPAVLAILPMKVKPANDASGTPSGIVMRLAELVIARPMAVGAATLGICIAAIAFIPTMTVNDQWSGYFDERLEFRQAIDAADPFFGSDNIEFVVDPGEPGAVTEPQFL
ncbi:MAG: MMPL family transporter, partial [Pseudomonadota bacterium]